MKLCLACSAMMCETYASTLQPAFCKYPGIRDESLFNELRSFNELRWFKGHTHPKYGKWLFLDSGAFSAFASGVPITVDEYSNFLERYHEQVDVYANLDSIPTAQTVEARKVAAAKTLQNQLILERRGFKPLPVFHCDEPYDYLEYYIEHYDYICLGGLVAEWGIDNFLSEVWGNYLTNSDGTPKRKIHGFGLTTLRHMVSYPWYTVDSQTWLIHCKLGILTYPPRLPDGSWDYTTRPTLLGVGKNSTMNKEEGKHYSNLDADRKRDVEEYVAQYGFTVEDLAEHPLNRFVANIPYWLNVEKAITKLHETGNVKVPAQKPFQLQLL